MTRLQSALTCLEEVTSLYKVISKVLATRLKKVLPSIINDSQMTFVKGRKILDAILIASEA